MDDKQCEHRFKEIDFIYESNLKLSKCPKCKGLKLTKYKAIKEKILYESDFIKG